jgi:cell division protein FtsB
LTVKGIQRVEEILGLSLKVIIITAIVIILFGVYLGVLIYGENSLTVLSHLKQEKKSLLEEAQLLKNENQKLQKEYFELKQLEPSEE